MKFSEYFGVPVGEETDWFDALLSVDTPLFIDPFLIYDGEFDVFEGSHAEIIAFFNGVFQLVGRSAGDTSALVYLQAYDAVHFPEVEEVCLGYTREGTKGAGSGKGSAKAIAAAMWEAIEAGLN